MTKENSRNTRKDIFYTSVGNDKIREKLQVEEMGPVPIIGARHWQCAWYFVMNLITYGTRVSLSVAIVAMTDPTASVNPDVPTYPHWTQKGAILSAFFWGYLWPQILAGYVANRFGAKYFLISTVAIQSVLGVLTPFVAAHLGQIGLMAVRATQGFCQGFFFPTLFHLLSQWAPQEERGRLTSIAMSSVPFGTVVAIFITGIIAAGPYGWPMVFYLNGVLGLAWCLLFYFLGYNSPSEHPTISPAEKFYIENSLGHTDEKPSHKVPWKAIFTSVPVWALLAAQCGWVFGFWILLTQIPSYMNHIMHFSIKDNSMLSCLPYLTQFGLNLALSFVSDFINNKKLIGATASRKLYIALGSVFPATALIFLAYTKSDQPNRAVILLIIAVGSCSAGNLGWSLNFMDLTSSHSGTLMGMCNATSHIFALLAPLIVQFLVKDETDPDQWKIVFFVAAILYIVTSIIYIIFGSAEKQEWNDDEDKNKDKEKQ